jgi:ribonuclease R
MKINEKIKGKLEINPNGSGYLITENEKIYVYKKNTDRSLDGDYVEIEIIPGKTRGTIEGKVIKVLERNRKLFTGIVQKVRDFGFLIIDSKRIPVDFYLTKKQVKKYQIGEKLLVELLWWEKGRKPECKVIKSLGMVGENDAEMDTIIYEYGLDTDFTEKVEKESEEIDWNISQEEIDKRRDFRNILTFTIDPDTAKDFDDAISIRPIENDKYEIGIHIADVSHYIKEETELDKEAYRRATSVYLVDRVIPMLPERLSNGVCSLRPNEDKLTYSVVIHIDLNGNISNKWIGRTIINSDRRFTYEEAQEIIEGNSGDFDWAINTLNTISQELRKKRNSLMFDRSEVKFELDHEFVPIGVDIKENNESHQLIEELMLVANRIVGKYLSENGLGIYRNHDEPNEDKLLELKQISNQCGFDLDLNDVKNGLNKLNSDVKGTPFENMIQTLGVRSMSKAEYSVNNIGHYGLGFDYYTHFTSPIRRYPDVIAHRLLTKFLNNKFTSENPVKYQEKCEHCNSRELNAKRAERDSIKYKQVEYLLGKVGYVYSGNITGITDWGVYVELDENHCEGLIRSDDIEGYIDKDSYEIDMEDGRTLRLGDTIMVKVFKVSLLKKEIDLILF